MIAGHDARWEPKSQSHVNSVSRSLLNRTRREVGTQKPKSCKQCQSFIAENLDKFAYLLDFMLTKLLTKLLRSPFQVNPIHFFQKLTT